MAFSWDPAILLGAIVFALVLLRGLPPRSRTLLDLVLLCAISAWLLWRQRFPVFEPAPELSIFSRIWLQALEAAWWLIAARLAASLVRLAFGHDRRSREMRLFSDLAAGGIYLGAVLVVLSFVLDLPIRGLVATSGIIAVVLGLALQSTLADVFAGIAVGIEQPFHVGDRVRLGDHLEGTVVQTNWRSVRIQTDEEDIAVIPNSTVAKAEIVNRSSPTKRRGARVEITCRATIPPHRIVALLEQAVLLCPDILDQPSPTIALAALGDQANTYSVAFAVADGKVSVAKSLLLCQVRRLLHHAGLLEAGAGAGPDAKALLRELVLLESLEDAQIAALADQLVRRSLAPGETLFAEGETDATLYIVEKGVLDVRRGSEKMRLGRIGPGEYIGEIGLLTGSAHSATLAAATDASVWLMSREAIAPLMQQHELAAALEASVHRGIALANRDSAAARVSSDATRAGALLEHIRHFFHLPPHADAPAPRQLEHGEAGSFGTQLETGEVGPR